MIGRVGAATADEARRGPLLRQARLAYEASSAALKTEGDRAALEARYRTSLATLSARAPALSGQAG
jgi:hypothetical protein